jgi:hypothetical protein
MKHLQFLLILSLLFVCDSLLAQKKNYPGYYITQQGDTVKGTFPMYTQWNKNPLQVTFKVDGKTDQIELTPQNARAFVVEGNDEYISHTGLRLLNPIEDAWLYGEQVFINSNDSTEQVSIFLRLAKRTVNIEFYVLDDTKRQNFFYKLPGQPIIELLYKKNFVQGKIKEVAAYKQQLNNLFADIIAKRNLKSSLEKLPYDEEEISSFLGKLFPSANHELMPKVSKTEWVVSAGLALNMVNIDPGKLDELVPNSYSSSFSPVASARIIIPLGRNFGKYFFSPQIKVFRYKSTGEITDGNLIKIATYKADLAAIAQLSVE